MIRTYVQTAVTASALTAASTSFSWSWKEFLFAVGSAVFAAVMQFVGGRLVPPSKE